MDTSLNLLSVSSGGPYIPLRASGSSRYRSYIWPEPFAVAVNTTGTASTGARLRQTNAGVGILISGYGGGVAFNPGLINQHAGSLATTTAAAGVGARLQGQILQVKTSKSIILPQWDDMQCMRIWANLACSAGVIPGNDQGFFCVHPGGVNQRIFADPAEGFGFSIGQNGVVQWVVRGPNGLIQTNLTASPYDITVHHTYEMILVGATKTADAYLVALIDSVVQPLPVLSRSWAAGSNLPANTTVGGISNFAAQVTADSHVLNATVHCHQLGVVWGPTPQSLY